MRIWKCINTIAYTARPTWINLPTPSLAFRSFHQPAWWKTSARPILYYVAKCVQAKYATIASSQHTNAHNRKIPLQIWINQVNGWVHGIFIYNKMTYFGLERNVILLILAVFFSPFSLFPLSFHFFFSSFDYPVLSMCVHQYGKSLIPTHPNPYWTLKHPNTHSHTITHLRCGRFPMLTPPN